MIATRRDVLAGQGEGWGSGCTCVLMFTVGAVGAAALSQGEFACLKMLLELAPFIFCRFAVFVGWSHERRRPRKVGFIRPEDV
jgi:hypothetical protein